MFIRHLPCASHYSNDSVYVNSLKLYNDPMNRYLQYPHFTHEKIEVCGGLVVCPAFM